MAHAQKRSWNPVKLKKKGSDRIKLSLFFAAVLCLVIFVMQEKPEWFGTFILFRWSLLASILTWLGVFFVNMLIGIMDKVGVPNTKEEKKFLWRFTLLAVGTSFVSFLMYTLQTGFEQGW